MVRQEVIRKRLNKIDEYLSIRTLCGSIALMRLTAIPSIMGVLSGSYNWPLKQLQTSEVISSRIWI